MSDDYLSEFVGYGKDDGSCSYIFVGPEEGGSEWEVPLRARVWKVCKEACNGDRIVPRDTFHDAYCAILKEHLSAGCFVCNPLIDKALRRKEAYDWLVGKGDERSKPKGARQATWSRLAALMLGLMGRELKEADAAVRSLGRGTQAPFPASVLLEARPGVAKYQAGSPDPRIVTARLDAIEEFCARHARALVIAYGDWNGCETGLNKIIGRDYTFRIPQHPAGRGAGNSDAAWRKVGVRMKSAMQAGLKSGEFSLVGATR